jgi:hypothetical protein
LTLFRGAEREGERTIRRRGASCATVLEPLALVAALLLDAVQERATYSLPETGLDATPPRAWRVHASAGALAMVELIPGVAPGALVAPPDAPAIELGLAVLPESAASGPPGASFHAAWATLGVCGELALLDWLWLDGCGAIVGGAVLARGRGGAVDREAIVPHVAIEGSLGLEAMLVGPLGLSVSVGAQIPLIVPTYAFDAGDDDVVVHRPWPVVPFGAFSVIVRTSS